MESSLHLTSQALLSIPMVHHMRWTHLLGLYHSLAVFLVLYIVSSFSFLGYNSVHHTHNFLNPSKSSLSEFLFHTRLLDNA